MQNVIDLNLRAMHEDINSPSHQQDLSMRISASKKPNAHPL